MKNLLDDPDVAALYKDLQNKKYENIDDYLTSNPTDDFSGSNYETPTVPKLPEKKVFFGGEEISGFIESDDYGL